MANRGRVYNRVYNEDDWALVNEENKAIMEDYLEEYKQRKMKPKTILQYFYDLRIVLIFILKKLNNRNILELKKKDFRKFNLWCQEKEMSNARVNRLMSSIRSMLNYVEEDDDYDYESNVARKVKGLPKEPVKTNEDDFFLSFDQVMKVREELIKRNELQLAVLWMLFYDSAGRRNEVFQVTKHDLLEGNKTNIVIGKRGKTFPLVYLNDTKELIKLYLEERGEDEIDSLWIVGTGENKRAISYEAIYDRIVQVSKVLSEIENKQYDIFCHTLRHTRIEHLLNGEDTRLIDKKTGEPRKYSLEEVQVYAHHSDPSVTLAYAKDHSEDMIDNMFDFN